MDGSPGVSRLMRTLSPLITRSVPMQEWLDYGTIQADMSLRLDRFGIPFPQGTYFVIKLRATAVITEPAAVGDHGAHTHQILTIDVSPDPQPGDRVAVGRYADGVDPVIFGVLGRV